MGLGRLNTGKILVFGILWIRALKLSLKMAQKCVFDWFLMILFICSIRLLDFVAFWQSRIIFSPMEKNTTMFQI